MHYSFLRYHIWPTVVAISNMRIQMYVYVVGILAPTHYYNMLRDVCY